jgi:transglutaminase-like putative cysteine protease
MNMKSAFLFAFAFCGALLFADDITLEKYPDADAVSVKSVREVTYNSDGTYVDHDEEWIKVLTEKGRRDESELALRYSARYGTARIIAVSIIDTNGVERAVDISGTMSESTDNSSMDENIYDPMDRRIVCTVPGLKVGETLRYSFERSIHKPRFAEQWATSAIFEWECPILDSTIRIIAPKDHPIRKSIVRNPLGNVTESREEREDGRIVYTWHVVNTPQAFSEPDTPPFYLLVQNLQVSTSENWEELSKWYWDLCLPHIEKSNEAISNKVVEVLANAKSADYMERIRALYKWVAQEVRYMGLTMEDTSPGYAPHDVDITFDNRYGVCRDKAALLVAMLRLGGIEAYPVLIQAGAKRDSEVPSPFFNHAIVAVANPSYRPDPSLDDQTDGKYILMDPTDESSRDLMPAYLCNCSYMVARPEGETLRTSPVVSADDNSLVVNAYGTLAPDGSILLKQTIVFNGTNDNAYRQVLLRRRPEARRKVFESILRARFPGAELMRCVIEPADLRDTGKPLSVNLISRLPETVLRGDTCDQLNTPLISPAMGAASWLLGGKTSLESRKYPLVVSSTASAVETLKLDLGGNVGAALSLPVDRNVEGKYEYVRTFRIDGDMLVVHRKAALNAVEFSPEEYAILRETMKEVEDSERERPIFGKNDLADANVRFLQCKYETDLQGDSSWTVTNSVMKEILTYDGKKSSSELSFAYNPTWETVEVVSAVVSNLDGKVSWLSPKEVNVMDCDWASNAPRYPASKQMIVNLPSVEIGSVISYVIARTAKDAPASFYGRWNFDVYEPTDEYMVRIGDECRIVNKPKLLKVEPMAAPGEFWRDFWVVSSNSFHKAAEKLRLAAKVKPVKSEHRDIKSIRDWMVGHVRISGPSLYEVPIEMQLTEPDVVLKEHYASQLDFMRTMCALMRGAGYEADVVFSSSNGGLDPQLKDFDMEKHPNVRSFSIPLCRVREKKGGWLGGLLPFGREETTYFIGTENEFTPIGASAYAGSNYFDPQTEEFGLVTNVSDEYSSYSRNTAKLNVRENGTVDFDVENQLWGPAVGAFRKKYEEMLPEDRSRHYQELLGRISQSASATKELVVDTKAYPATRSYSCCAPSFAFVEGNVITVTLPDFYAPLFPLVGVSRENPICLDPVEGQQTIYSVTFPEGYTEIEHLPGSFAFRSTLNFYHIWFQSDVSSRLDENGRLVVDVVRTRAPRIQTVIAAEYFGMLKDWSRIGSSRSNRTIMVRRADAK